MSNQEDNDKHKAAEDKGVTFDMYHFFSRKDVLFAGALILLLLIYVVYKILSGPAAV